MRSVIKRIALGVDLALALGSVLTPLGCGGAGEAGYAPAVPSQRDPAEVPETVVAQLTDCLKQAAAPFPPAQENKYSIQFNVHASKSGRVDEVEAQGSTLGGNAVEACMARVLQGSTLPVRATAMQPAPESRALVGNPALLALAPVSLAPVMITGIGIIVVVAVIIYVATDKDDDERTRCKKVKRACLDHCSDTALDLHEPHFTRCMRACMEENNCVGW